MTGTRLADIIFDRHEDFLYEDSRAMKLTPYVMSERCLQVEAWGIFKDAHDKYGSRAWSSMVVKRLEDICKINFRASGYPKELVDKEKEEKGYEI